MEEEDHGREVASGSLDGILDVGLDGSLVWWEEPGGRWSG
jgi:hypothetical protein